MGLFSDLFGKANAKPEPVRHVASAIFFEREPGYRKINVVGESYYQHGIRLVTGRVGNEGLSFDCIAALVLEPDNEHDKNAIAVQVEGEMVGYLSHEDAMAYRGVVRKAAKSGQYVAGEARIAAVDPEHARTPNAGVVVWLPPPSQALSEI